MKIKTNSMTYQFWKHNFALEDEAIPDNLCPYMRGLVKGIFVTFGAWFIVALLAVGMIASPVAVVLYWAGIFSEIPPLAWAFLATDIFITILVTYLLLDKSGRVDAAIATLRKSVTYSWFEAIHDKVCPRITFDD